MKRNPTNCLPTSSSKYCSPVGNTVIRATASRALLTKQEFSPEEERAFRWFLGEYRDQLGPIEDDIREFLRGASDTDLSSLDAIRTELEGRFGAYTSDFEVVFREGGEQGAAAGRELAARRFGLDIAFDTIPERTLEEIDDWVDVAAGSTLETITEDATRWLRGAHEEGLSIDEITEQLMELDEHLEETVAHRAARTAVNSTSRAGHHSAHEDAPGVVAERWISELRDNTREDHEEAHGQTVGVDVRFEVGGVYMLHPGDPSAPVGQIANCLCQARPLFEDDLTEAELEAVESGERIWT